MVFKDAAAEAQGVDALIDALAAKAGARVEHRYRSLLPGFAGTMSERAARRLAADPAVKYVEQNQIVFGGIYQPMQVLLMVGVSGRRRPGKITVLGCTGPLSGLQLPETAIMTTVGNVTGRRSVVDDQDHRAGLTTMNMTLSDEPGTISNLEVVVSRSV